jgi:RNA recognition motif-containing protein
MNIYIANFGAQTNNDELKNLFTPHGVVESAEVMIDSFTDKPRGFGYVDMPDNEQAKAAIAALDQSLFNGQTLTVKEASPREDRRGSYKVGTGGVNPYRFKKN